MQRPTAYYKITYKKEELSLIMPTAPKLKLNKKNIKYF
jgi:hypothetical protein